MNQDNSKPFELSANCGTWVGTGGALNDPVYNWTLTIKDDGTF